MENIQVALRIRPQNECEQENNDLEVWSVINQQQIGIAQSKYAELVKQRKIVPGQKFNYAFNQCFGKSNTTYQLYTKIVKRIALSSLQGINGTVFMYGQTGSGKTFTMMGKNAHDMQSLEQNQNNNQQLRGRQEGNRQDNKQESTSKIVNQQNIKSVFNSFTSLLERRSKTPSELDGNFPQLDVQKLKGLLNHNSKTPNSEETSKLLDSQQLFLENKEGILISALHDIFSEIENINDKKFFLKCSYLEIYTDQVYDLLGSQEKMNEILTINEDQNKEFYIKNATEEIVSSIQDVLDKLLKGEQNRHYAATIMNHQSSRSHTIFRLVIIILNIKFLQYVKSIPQNFAEGSVMTESILNFVDLAGSEKVSMHDPMRTKKRDASAGAISSQAPTNLTALFKERVNESKHINKSLFFLTQVISLKSQGKPDMHIAYRNSPLTKILRSSLGGNSRTCVILCINPCISQLEQTLSTLRFGLNAKKIENSVYANYITTTNDEQLKLLITQYEKKFQEMQKERESDKNTSANLRQIIEGLQDQKKQLNLRLKTANESQFTQQSKTILQKLQEKKKSVLSFQDEIYMDNIGIISVLNYQGDDIIINQSSNSKSKNESKICKQENMKILNELNQAKKKCAELEKAHSIEVSLNNDYIHKLAKKKKKIQNLKENFEKEQNKFQNQKRFLQLFDKRNPQELQNISPKGLLNFEKFLFDMLDLIKTEKIIRTLKKQSSENGSSLENTIKNLRNTDFCLKNNEFETDFTIDKLWKINQSFSGSSLNYTVQSKPVQVITNKEKHSENHKNKNLSPLEAQKTSQFEFDFIESFYDENTNQTQIMSGNRNEDEQQQDDNEINEQDQPTLKKASSTSKSKSNINETFQKYFTITSEVESDNNQNKGKLINSHTQSVLSHLEKSESQCPSFANKTFQLTTENAIVNTNNNNLQTRTPANCQLFQQILNQNSQTQQQQQSEQRQSLQQQQCKNKIKFSSNNQSIDFKNTNQLHLKQTEPQLQIQNFQKNQTQNQEMIQRLVQRSKQRSIDNKNNSTNFTDEIQKLRQNKNQNQQSQKENCMQLGNITKQLFSETCKNMETQSFEKHLDFIRNLSKN